jgi:hypothetical protein
MRALIPCIISACLTIAFSFSAMSAAFSQVDQEHSPDSTPRKNEGTAPYVSGITPARAKSLVGAVVGLLSVIIGWRVKSRSAVRSGSGKSWIITALILGIVAIALSVFHLATTSGGFGTGGGKAGAIVALVLGLVGTSLGGFAMRLKARG